MNAKCVAIIGKQNNPLLLRNYTHGLPAAVPDLTFHHMIHTVLDVVEEKAANSTDPYLGLLYALEDLVVYGAMTSTRVKFILVLGMSDVVTKDQEIRAFFRRLQNAYTALVTNPFFALDSMKTIQSRNFNEAIDTLLQMPV